MSSSSVFDITDVGPLSFPFVSWCRLMLHHLWGAIAMGLEIATRWVVNVGHDGRISQPFRRWWHRWCPPWPLMVTCCRPWPKWGSLSLSLLLPITVTFHFLSVKVKVKCLTLPFLFFFSVFFINFFRRGEPLAVFPGELFHFLTYCWCFVDGVG